MNDLTLQDKNSTNNRITRAQFYVICQYSRLSSRAWTTALIYDTLASDTETQFDESAPSLEIETAKSFFAQLQTIVNLNKRMGTKLKLGANDYVIGCSPLCINSNGALGRLYISCESLFFGVCTFSLLKNASNSCVALCI